jgi:hypothetical protein
MGQPSNRPPRPRIETLDLKELEERLRGAARGVCPDRLMDDLEVRHLVRVIHECSLLLSDVYSEDRIARIMRPDRELIDQLIAGLLDQESSGPDDGILRFRELPDQVRLVGDKALFDLGLLGLRNVKGYDLADLGARAYRSAGEALELLAEDRRLQELFKQNRLLMLPLEEEVVFLRQCSRRFRLYAEILKHTHGVVDEDAAASIAEAASRVPLMAAAAEVLVEDERDHYVEAGRCETAGESDSSRERVLSSFERTLLFSSLDMARLRDALDSTVIDQQRAVKALCDDFSLFAAGTRDPRKPPSYFLVGPTGVGKNHLIESLCRLLEGVWRIPIPILTIEGPNYTYPSDINELRGATRGFIRSDEEGLLTSYHETSSRAPLGVILVDEVEKAHPHLLTFFLSILDRGTTTDNRGTVLDFANCLIVFTSNLGYSDAQREAAPIGYLDRASRHRASDRGVRARLRHQLKPEFVNRVRTIHFDRLGEASAERILDLEFERIARRYREIHEVSLALEPSARAELLRRGFSPEFGARHLGSTLEAICNVEIAKKLLRDGRTDGGDDRLPLVDWLREIRSGRRAFDEHEVRKRVGEITRARVDYDTLCVVFRDGRFEYVPRRRDARR